MACPDVLIGRFNSVKKSCKFIEVNPPLYVGEMVPTIVSRSTLLVDQRAKSPQLWGTRVIRLSYRILP